MLALCGVLLHRCEPKIQSSEPGANNAQGTAGGRKELTELEAVERAEEFIAANGYTDLPPMEDKAKLFYESLEGGAGPDEVLSYRRNQLERLAYGVRRGCKGQPGWTIVFRFSKSGSAYSRAIPDFDRYTQEYGRWVTMDPHGDNIRVEHEDIPLKEADKRLGR